MVCNFVEDVQVCQPDLTSHLFLHAFQINGSINLKLAWCDYPSDAMTFSSYYQTSHHTLTLTSHFDIDDKWIFENY